MRRKKDVGRRATRSVGLSAYDESVMNLIMLRFRPIVPKPTDGGEVRSIMSADKTSNGGTANVGKVRRSQKSHVRVKKVKSKRIENKASNHQYSPFSLPVPVEEKKDGMVTLQLLPEKSDLCSCNNPQVQDHYENQLTSLFTKGNAAPTHSYLQNTYCGSCKSTIAADKMTVKRDEAKPVVVKSRIIVESMSIRDMVSATTSEGLSSDMENILFDLQEDPCPAFVSDNYLNRVLWVNEAYMKMVMSSEKTSLEEEKNRKASDNNEKEKSLMVVIVVKEKLPDFWGGFACRVRMEYERDGKRCSKIVPCDVWRLNFGGFAWKLDIKAALSLGL